MLQSYVFSLPVDKGIMFTDHKGQYKKKIEKRQRDLIVKIPFIKPFLKPEENIQLITTGYSRMNTLGQFLTAWFFIYLKRSLFIFTNERIFHIPTTVRYRYRYTIAQILYSKNHSVRLKGHTLVVKCGVCGDQIKYTGIRGKEKKKIREILKKVKFNGRYNPSSEMAHLCPRCTRELSKGTYICSNCKLKFKKKSKLRSLMPGFGYFYVRQTFLGVINITVELILIGFLISFCLKLLHGVETANLYLMLFGGLLIFEKIATMCHSSHFIHEYLPEIEEVKPLVAI